MKSSLTSHQKQDSENKKIDKLDFIRIENVKDLVKSMKSYRLGESICKPHA